MWLSVILLLQGKVFNIRGSLLKPEHRQSGSYATSGVGSKFSLDNAVYGK